MKTITFLLIICILPFANFAQDAASKKVQAGLVFGSGLNFQDVKNTDYFETKRVGTDLTVGMNMNFNLYETISLCTGVEFDFSNTYLKTNNNIFYHYKNENITLRQDNILNSYNTFRLDSRKDKTIYLTLPTMLLLRTKFIGYFRYFGKFGLRNSFMLKNESFDDGWDYKNGSLTDNTASTSNSEYEKEHMTTEKNLFFYKGAIGIAAGAEWNFSGTTSLVGELGYYYGLTPLYWERDTDNNKLSLFTSGFNSSKGDDVYHPIKARQSQLMMKISILF